ncbi:MAG: hypothetical protein Q9187_000703 [Circinaria calcarea]
MTRKKKSQGMTVAGTVANLTSQESPPQALAASSTDSQHPSSTRVAPGPSKLSSSETSTSALIICRNKYVGSDQLLVNARLVMSSTKHIAEANCGHNRHWRYISSFHGPWLQLPPEVLESLAFSNYSSPRPRPIDPAVFFDLVKVRRLVEDATNLAVRAANGTTSSSLSNSLNAGNGILGGGGAAALGLGLGNNGSTAKLSRERKHRMRELATQKLSQAYQFDEIAASVATMQSASSLEEVAHLVLQRNASDTDAKYVHFFHEKIPSRMLAQCTSLKPLDEVLQERPNNTAALRTRAVTRIFKDDFSGAARDLTDALATHRYLTAQHNARRGQLTVVNALGGPEKNNSSADESTVDMGLKEENRPSSLEPQLLFHRAGVYLTLACQYIHSALLECPGDLQVESGTNGYPDQSCSPKITTETDTRRLQQEARKLVKTYAKRALRDYMSFLSNFDYTSGQPFTNTEEFFRKVNAAANGSVCNKDRPPLNLLEMSGNTNLSNGTLSDALVPRKSASSTFSDHQYAHSSTSLPLIPAPEVHQVSTLFSASPPASLPPYPAESLALIPLNQNTDDNTSLEMSKVFLGSLKPHEAVTYHPLLTDALHSLLLCHSLMQTSPKEHLRHAHMVGRLARVCDGYPIFLAARSPSRADWIEVIRRARNWIGLRQSWEALCAPAPLPGEAESAKKEETLEEARERARQEAIMEALADERVHDEASFQAAVAAREKRAEEQRKDDLMGGPQRWAQADGKEYPISTERAEAISRWVTEAPRIADGTGKPKRGEKKEFRKKADQEIPKASDLIKINIKKLNST